MDVVPAHQGRGLAPLVVRAATAAILARGGEPFDACAATSSRSHRTALAAGFQPACSDASVTSAGAAVEQLNVNVDTTSCETGRESAHRDWPRQGRAASSLRSRFSRTACAPPIRRLSV